MMTVVILEHQDDIQIPNSTTHKLYLNFLNNISICKWW